MADTFNNGGPFPDWLMQRGLGDIGAEKIADIPPAPEPALPYDYAARVKAAELAMEEMGIAYGGPPEPSRTMQRALDWHAFLTAQPGGKDDE